MLNGPGASAPKKLLTTALAAALAMTLWHGGAGAPSVGAVPQRAPSVARLTLFPVAGTCSYSDTYGAPRSGGRRHEGVDIIAAEGTPLVAVVAGRISKVVVDSPGSISGNYFRLTHADGTYFTYIHLSRFAAGLRVGTVVKAGDTLGYVGHTGNTSVSHLHFEVHPFGGAAVNPTPYVTAAGGCRTVSRPVTTPPPVGNPTRSFSPAVVVYNSSTRIKARTATGIQVVGFPGIPSSAKLVHLTVTLTGSTSGRAAIWPCGASAGLNGGTPLTMTWPGAPTSTSVALKPGTGGRVCLEAESAASIKIAVTGYS